MSIIQVRRLSKCFELHPDRPRSFQELVVGFFAGRGGRRAMEPLWALQDLSFSVERGETVGLIGSNGSGKSTCLKLLTRILEPTVGQVTVDGRVSALLELGAGFHPELTGRENVYLQGSVMGLNRREMAARMDDIIAFSELARFVDVPVKVYSSGMYVRLAFATAINVEADVLLVDEVLAVGDQSYQHKCLERIYELKARGVTIVFVSHDLDSVRSVCDRVLWLDRGTLRAQGIAEEVVGHYLQHEYEREMEACLPQAGAPPASGAPGRGGVASGIEAGPGVVAGRGRYGQAQDASGTEGSGDSPQPGGRLRFAQGRWGSGEVQVERVTFEDAEGRSCQVLRCGEPATIVIQYRAGSRVEGPVFGVAFFRNDGLHLSGSNSHLGRLELPYVEGRGEVRYELPAMPFLAGSYLLTVAIHGVDESAVYDYHSLGYAFRVHLGRVNERYGTVYVPARWAHRVAEAEGCAKAEGGAAAEEGDEVAQA